MSNQAHNEDEVLARLVREAGDRGVSPDPLYVKELRARITDRVSEVACGRDDVSPATKRGTNTMKRVAHIVIAAAALAAVALFASWLVMGGGTASIAFAEVAKALDSLRTAAFDEATEVKDPVDGKSRTLHSKSLFLAPSRQRCEMAMPTGSGTDTATSIMILDFQAMKGLTLIPEQKQAVAVDLAKIKKPSGPSNMFEQVRQLVRQGSSGAEKAESLGRKQVDGRAAVGFRIKNNMADMTFWADPQSARPVRIELDSPSFNARSVMSNFRYDMELDSALFSLEPPAGYDVRSMEAAMPVEEDLVNLLRLVVEHNDGIFPPTIGANKEYMQAVQADSKAKAEKLIKTPEAQKLMEKLKAEYGDDKDGFMKAWMKEWMKLAEPTTQKHMQGLLFYQMLTPENDSHYAGKDVKQGTPNRPIFWYKPTGSAKYRVIYADLSVKELAPKDAQQLPEAGSK